MVRVINARNLLQTTIYDADNLINKQRKSSIEVFNMVNRRLKILSNPPSYVRIDWSDSYMEKVVSDNSIIESMFDNLERSDVGKNFFGFDVLDLEEDERYD